MSSCAREAPDVREIRPVARAFFRGLVGAEVKGIGDRSTCIGSTNSFAGARVLSIGPPQRVRMGDLDSLVKSGMAGQAAAEAEWGRARDATADSLFKLARLRSNQAAVYRNAARAVPLSAPNTLVARDSTLELRSVRARFRYAGPVIGPKPVDREEAVHLLRAPRGG